MMKNLLGRVICVCVVCVAVCGELKAEGEALFSMGAVADLQYADTEPRGGRTPREVPRRLQEAVDFFNGSDVEFVMSLGDFIDWDDMDYTWPPVTDVKEGKSGWKHYETMNSLWEKIRVPRYHVLGNHEWYVPDVADDGKKPERVLSKFGFKDKGYYDFEHGGVRFVVLDGNDRYMYAYVKGSEEYEDAKRYYDAIAAGSPEKKTWNGAITAKQLEWLRLTLEDAKKRGQRVVVCCHYPVHEPVEPHTLLNHAEVRAVLDDFSNVVLWLNGHNHRGSYALVNEGKKNERHHFNLRGMQNWDGSFYRLVFYKDRVEVFQGGSDQAERVMKW